MKEGLVLQSTGSWYQVQDEDGNIHQARVAGKMRLDNKKVTNPIAVGDKVNIRMDEEASDVIITGVQERRNYIVREAPKKRMNKHILAANIDYALILVTIRQPNLKLGFLDRYLTACEAYQVTPLIVVNKIDLLQKEKDIGKLANLIAIYSQEEGGIGYEVALVSAETGEGVEELKQKLLGKTTLISGNSGAGKSTLINALLPKADLRTNRLSKHTGKGQHTTTHYTLYPFEGKNGGIIDSPGIKELGIMDLQKEEVREYFKEMREMADGCKFSNCQHMKEPGCVVVDALIEGSLAETRYDSYLSIRDEIEEKKYWEI